LFLFRKFVCHEVKLKEAIEERQSLLGLAQYIGEALNLIGLVIEGLPPFGDCLSVLHKSRQVRNLIYQGVDFCWCVFQLQDESQAQMTSNDAGGKRQGIHIAQGLHPSLSTRVLDIESVR
jgi:hypothetical protein